MKAEGDSTKRDNYAKELDSLLRELSDFDEMKRRTAKPTADTPPAHDCSEQKAEKLARIRWLQDEIALLDGQES